MTQNLIFCQYSPGDDYRYLQENRWLTHVISIIPEIENKGKIVDILISISANIDADNIEVVLQRVTSRGAEYTYLNEIKLPNLDFNDRKTIEACFIASLFRCKLLLTPLDQRDTTIERKNFKLRLQNEYAEFMLNETGTDAELTYLFRFERTIFIAKLYMNVQRNKGLLLLVGSLLEGSEARYTIGGHSSKETRRRVRLIEFICDIKPRKKIEKALLQNTLQKKQKNEDGSNFITTGLAVMTLSQEIDEFFGFGFVPEKMVEDVITYQIYLGKKTKTGSEIILKIFKKSFQYLFEREVNLLKILNQSDHILRMLDFAEAIEMTTKFIAFENGYPYTMRELIGESSLIVITAIIEVMEAIQFVHSHNIIVRFLKLENIYLVGQPNDLTVKVGGLTYSTSSVDSQTQTKREDIVMIINDLILHDGLFTAPELLLDPLNCSISADGWTIGMIALFLLGGYLPWKEIIEMQKNFSFEIIETHQPKIIEIVDHLDCSEELKRFLKETLRISPTERKSLASGLQELKQVYSSKPNISLRYNNGSRNPQSLITFQKTTANFATAAFFDYCYHETPQIDATARFDRTELSYFSLYHSLVSTLSSLKSIPPNYLHLPPILQEKILWSGEIIMINTFQRNGSYSCHLMWNTRRKRKQVLKQINLKNAPQDLEYSILRTLNNHNNIILLEDYVEDTNYRYLFLERLDDGFLIDLLNVPLNSLVKGGGGGGERRNRSGLKENGIQSIAISLVSAVDYMHSKGIIHRGLNLSSIMIKRISEDEMRVKIWDFHSAILKEISYPASIYSGRNSTSSSSSYSVSGLTTTAPYPNDDEDGIYCLAPEILRMIVYSDQREGYDEMVDYWSVGIMLYILIVGESCFSLRNPAIIYQDILAMTSMNNNLIVDRLSADILSERGKHAIHGLLQFNPKNRLWINQRPLIDWLNTNDINNVVAVAVSSPYSLPIDSSSWNLSPWIIDGGSTASNLPTGYDFSHYNYSSGLENIQYPVITKPSSSSSPSPWPLSTPFIAPSTLLPQILPEISAINNTNDNTDTNNNNNLNDPIALLLETEVLKNYRVYLKYFDYQQALLHDDLLLATQRYNELIQMDNNFNPIYENKSAFREQYQLKYEEVEFQLTEIKKAAMMNPSLFRIYLRLMEFHRQLPRIEEIFHNTND